MAFEPFPLPRHRPAYAEVAIDRPLERGYSYLIPGEMEETLRVGSLVEVPLGRDVARGVVTRIHDSVAFKGPIKPVARHLTPDYAISAELMSLAAWISEYYWCSPGEALACASFVGLNDVHALTKSFLALAQADHWLSVSREVGPDGGKLSVNHRRVVASLLARANEPMAPAELAEDAGVSQAVLQTMTRHGWLERSQEAASRADDYPAEAVRAPMVPVLTTHQAVAVASLHEALRDTRPRTFLLHGVTGSGKTEVYLRGIEEALRLGREAIFLVPEIALTPQTVGALRSRLGAQVGVYHSRLTLGQKHDLWRAIASGDVRVLIGARSAIFAPFARLGLVIVDEEHEGSYKQGDAPRYHARDVAVLRAHRLGAAAVLGSATPSMESYHNAREGKYELLELPDRVGPHASPAMTVIDIKRHLTRPTPAAEGEGEARIANLLTPPLREAIERRLERGEQSVLLLNRRGFSNQALCMACEKPLMCPHCDVSLTYHRIPLDRSRPRKAGMDPGRFKERLVCHWCGHGEPMPEVCPKCRAPEIRTLGLGTQRVEEEVREAFPGARAIRIDVDTMKGRRDFIEAWERISRREVDIILGTQMIAKGFHLESVTLVGVVSADFALFLPDFRGAERTFNLLTQAAGRAGRGDLAGEVIVQTFMPRHYAIELAAGLREREFYQKELHIRRMLGFPPTARLIALLISGGDLESVREQAGRLSNMLKSLARRPAFAEVRVLGPAPAPIARIEDRHRWRILMRGPRSAELHALLRQGMAAFAPVHQKHKVAVTVDVDPMDLL